MHVLENNQLLEAQILGAPQLGRRGLYRTLAQSQSHHLGRQIADVLAFSDGQNTTLDIANICNQPFRAINEIVKIATKHELIRSI